MYSYTKTTFTLNLYPSYPAVVCTGCFVMYISDESDYCTTMINTFTYNSSFTNILLLRNWCDLKCFWSSSRAYYVMVQKYSIDVLKTNHNHWYVTYATTSRKDLKMYPSARKWDMCCTGDTGKVSQKKPFDCRHLIWCIVVGESYRCPPQIQHRKDQKTYQE